MGELEKASEQAVRQAIDSMHDNLGEPITVGDLARSARFSRFHFTRVFRQVTGVPPSRYLAELRLERAKQLLTSTSLNVIEVSVEVGYNSVGTFSTRFNRSIGESPTTYRRRVRSGYESTVPDSRPELAGEDIDPDDSQSATASPECPRLRGTEKDDDRGSMHRQR